MHALEPLVYAFKSGQILLISEPSICLGALWLPYRRDPAVMRAVLTAAAARTATTAKAVPSAAASTVAPSAEQLSSSGVSFETENEVQQHSSSSSGDGSSSCTTYISDPNNSTVSMVFCHADVRGALMNDNMQSKEGLEVSAFPPRVPVFSGHFHKPHTVSVI